MEPAKHYSDFSTNDFAGDDFFFQWVIYHNDENNAFWTKWIQDHPHKKWQIAEARAFIEALDFTVAIPDANKVQAALQDSLQRIAALEQEPVQLAPQRDGKRFRLWWAAAAAFTGGIALAGWLYQHNAESTVTYVSNDDGAQKIWLPDSSQMILNNYSSVTFRKRWKPGEKREVWLDGEAFFDVRPARGGKELAQEFIVHSGNMNIEVLGTSFNIKKGAAFTNVSLNTGKIRVAMQQMPEVPVYLAPGDFIQYKEKDNKITKKRVNAALYSIWKEEKQVLKDIPLQEMAQYIEDTYGHPVHITDRKLAATPISGSLRVKDEATLLETLSFAYNINIKKQGDTLYFNLIP